MVKYAPLKQNDPEIWFIQMDCYYYGIYVYAKFAEMQIYLICESEKSAVSQFIIIIIHIEHKFLKCQWTQTH